MHHLLALLRLIHRELYLLGPGIVPAVLGKYRMDCAWLIALLCAATAIYDLLRRRWLGGFLWVAAGAVLFAGFRSDASLWGSSTTVALGWAAIALGIGAILESLVQELRMSLASGRRERHALRRVRPDLGAIRTATDLPSRHSRRAYRDRD